MTDLTDYILSHSTAESDYLHRLWRAANIHLLHGRMASGHIQGCLLKMLVTMLRPKNVLEIGTFCGYSAICMAEGLPEDGRLWTYEINDEMEEFTRPWIDGSGVADKINFIIGDAITEAPKTGVTFDMAFIDGDKRHYIRDDDEHPALWWFYPRRQHLMGRSRDRPRLRPRPSDDRHTPIQRPYRNR